MFQFSPNSTPFKIAKWKNKIMADLKEKADKI